MFTIFGEKFIIMKKIFYLGLAILSGISFAICEIWVIVSFLLYMVKDEPFNWFVFWVGIGSLLSMILFHILNAISTVKERKSNPYTYQNRGKSKFQERLEAAQEMQRQKQLNK